uniref:Uncharacterized protein n=1 Tax=Trichobilharzia regenti TaxID=157069 RepID=A0AA85JYH9_TRIRE|nr:unnamed protein product [Trichobilharzia regenti]CAH8834187.1 unnamed protein product [Trichobilharzia regenti]
MVSNCDQFSSSTIPMQCKSEYNSSNPNQKDYQPDDPPVTPWIRGDVIYEGMVPADRGYVPKHIFGRRYFTKNGSKFYNGGGNYADGSNYYYYYHHHGRKGGGRTPNRYYYHAGQRIYYNNNATNNNNNNNGNYNNNNYRSRCPSAHSVCTSPLSSSQSVVNLTDTSMNDYYAYYKSCRAYHQHHHRCPNSSQPTGMTNEQLTDEYIDDCLSTDLAQYQLKLDMDSSLYDEYNTKIIMKRRENIDAWVKSSSPSMDSDLMSVDISQSSSSNNNHHQHHQSSQVFNDTYQGDFRHLQRKSKSTLDLLTSDATLNDLSNEGGKKNTKDTKVSEELTTNDSGNPIQEHTEEKLNAEDDSDMQKHCKPGKTNDYLTLVWVDPKFF